MGGAVLQGAENGRALLIMLGQLILDVGAMLRRPRLGPWREISAQVYRTGAQALGITALVGFLIGVVLSYLSAQQLQMIGADRFIVRLLGVSIVRELGPVLAAILVAGRSGSAITAQIGVMRVTQELDAMLVMGISHGQRLILPRVVALAVTMPLLVLWTSAMALLGGMLAAQAQLGVSAQWFLQSLPDAISLTNYWIGMMKGGDHSAFLIALIACHFGLRIQPNTESLGAWHHHVGRDLHYRRDPAGRGDTPSSSARWASDGRRHPEPAIYRRRRPPSSPSSPCVACAPPLATTSWHENLDLTVFPGEILVLVGGSGTGKTVLLRQIIGLDVPAAGTVKVLGHALSELTAGERRRLSYRWGMLFQAGGAVLRAVGVRQCGAALAGIAHGARGPGCATSSCAGWRWWACRRATRTSAPRTCPAAWSSAWRWRAPCRWTRNCCSWTSPTAGLDPLRSDEFVDLVRSLHRQLGFTVVMVTHDLDTLLALATRVAVLADKRVIICDTGA